MKQDVIIKVKDVEICFYVHNDGVSSFKQWIFSFGTKKLFRKSSVLKDISFEVKKGDSVGFLGRNGSGKSTILKAIAGVVPPEQGTIEVNGKIAPMLALGVGLEPELSGYENIKIGCSLMGISHARTKELMQSIVDFSELSDDDLKMQVKRYSSGMRARLGFSMVVSEQSDILIIDEALSVGDYLFVEKCRTRVKELQDSGTTILFVSHSLPEIKSFCNKAIWLHDGFLKAQGNVDEIAEMYLKG